MNVAAPSTLHCLSLCAGAGGLDLSVQLAFELIGWQPRTVCYVEREAYAASALVARMEDAALDDAPVWDDLRTFDGQPWRGKVDCLLAGYPCQPFSCAGKQLAELDPRHLWPEVDRIIGETKPWLVILENVSAHLRLGFGSVRRDLEGRGYTVAAGLFTAAEVGASHERERLVIVAYRAEQRHAGRKLSEPNGRNYAANAGRGGETVEYAANLERERQPRSRWETESWAEHGGGELANAGQPGFQGGERCGTSGERDGEAALGSIAELCEVPLFPPGPGDVDRWRDILASNPELAPALEPTLRGMADGLADGVDRLRLTGNGVVPLEIAYAILSLAAAEAMEP